MRIKKKLFLLFLGNQIFNYLKPSKIKNYELEELSYCFVIYWYHTGILSRIGIHWKSCLEPLYKFAGTNYTHVVLKIKLSPKCIHTYFIAHYIEVWSKWHTFCRHYFNFFQHVSKYFSWWIALNRRQTISWTNEVNNASQTTNIESRSIPNVKSSWQTGTSLLSPQPPPLTHTSLTLNIMYPTFPTD